MTWKTEYDWIEAFKYGTNVRASHGCDNSPICIDDVEEVFASSDGVNDERSWMMAGRLKDGRYFFLEAGCDYTGWDCQASGDVMLADTQENLYKFAMTNIARERLIWAPLLALE